MRKWMKKKKKKRKIQSQLWLTLPKKIRNKRKQPLFLKLVKNDWEHPKNIWKIMIQSKNQVVKLMKMVGLSMRKTHLNLLRKEKWPVVKKKSLNQRTKRPQRCQLFLRKASGTQMFKLLWLKSTLKSRIMNLILTVVFVATTKMWSERHKPIMRNCWRSALMRPKRYPRWLHIGVVKASGLLLRSL